MCTRPDYGSVSGSARALCDIFGALLPAFSTLVIALVAAPVRVLAGPQPPAVRPATTRHVSVQVLLEDHRRVSELQRTIRHALDTTAATWAPLRLPIDRVVAGVGLPVRGRVDVYEDFPRTAPGSDFGVESLVVVTL